MPLIPDLDAIGGLPGGQVLRDFLAVGHNDDGTTRPSVAGVVADGTTDDTAALQAVIDATATAGGGVINLPLGNIKITASINLVDKNGVVLVGAGGSNEPYSTTGSIGTVISWFGAGGGTMVKTGASNGATVYGRNQGLENLTLDGRDVAGTGLLVTSGWFHRYRRVHVKLCTTVHIDLTTIPGPGAAIGEDTQFCVFEQVSTRPSAGASASAIGLRMNSGATPQAGQGNTSLNDFYQCHIGHYNGTGVEIRDADSNRFFSLQTSSNGGTGIGIDLRGSSVANYGQARANVFFMYDPAASTGGIVSRGTALTQPAVNNRFIDLSLENNAAFLPTIEAGSTCFISTNKGGHNELANYNGDMTIGTTTANAVLWRANNTVRMALESGANLGWLIRSYGNGVGVISIGNAATPPNANPTGGGILYAEGGVLKWRGSSGTVTPIAPA